MTDAELLRGAQRGDADAWRALYQRALPAVWRQAYALVTDRHAAEDITSETMLALLKNINRLEINTPKLGGWLRAVVRCKAADHQRKQFRERTRLPLAADAAAERSINVGPSASLEAVETQQHVWQILDGLPDRQRIVLEWKYLDALRVREIAERLGDSEKAVETVLYRARREFRRRFESQPLRVIAVSVNGHAAEITQRSQS